MPLEFLSGVFQPNPEDAIAVDLRIYRDGLIADTQSSTADSEHFIEDLLHWGSNAFGLLPAEGIVQVKRYVSELYVTTDRVLSALNPKLTAFSELLSREAKGYSSSFEPGAIGFWPDQNSPNSAPPFRFERAENVPFVQKRYWSIAPPETETHFGYLTLLENLLSGE